MTTYHFGASPDLVSVDATTGRPRTAVPATFYSAETGGTQDLTIIDTHGGTGGTAVSGVFGRWEFTSTTGPELWLDTGTGVRWLVRAQESYGPTGTPGATGPASTVPGPTGPPGPSGGPVPVGGTDGQVVAKSGGGVVWANGATDASMDAKVAAQHTSDNSTFGRRTVFNVKTYGAVGNADTDDTAAIAAAITAAHAASSLYMPSVVWFPQGNFVTSPINLDGKCVTLQGDGVHSCILTAKAGSTDYLITVPSGWLGSAPSNLWRTRMGGFRIEGTNTANATAFVPGQTAQAIAGGIKLDNGFSIDLADISIRNCAGPGLWMRNIVLSRFSNVVLNRPVGADTNAVPYFYSTGWTNENAYENLLFQSPGGTDGPAVIHIDQDSAYASMNQGRWSGTQFENMHTPANGAIWDTQSSTTTYTGSAYEDCTGVAGNAAVMRLRGSGASGGLGGSNYVTGLVYSAHYARGVLVGQSGNVISGPADTGRNVEIAAGVTDTTVTLGGTSVTPATVLDGSGNTTNLVVNPATYTAVARTNLCTNPNFETSAAGWATYSGSTGVARSTVTPYTGTGRLIFAGNDSAATALVYTTILGVPGDTLTVTALMRVDGQSVAAIRAFVDFYPDAVGTVVGDTPYTTGVDGWKAVSVTATLPAGGTCFRVALGVNNDGVAVSSTTCTIGLDNVLIEKATPGLPAKIGAYFDGASANTPTAVHLWTGTANLSTSREIAPTSMAAPISSPASDTSGTKAAIDAILATLKANGLSA